MVFWILTGAVALVVAAGLGWSVLRGTRETGPAEAFDMQGYRDQLAEIDSDAARGKIDAEEAERLRLEISRRLLAADAKAQGGSASVVQPAGISRVTAGMLTLVLLVGGFGLYLALGVPGYRDQPRHLRLSAAADALKNRASQAEAADGALDEIGVTASVSVASPTEPGRSVPSSRPRSIRYL